MTADPNVSIETGAQWKNSFKEALYESIVSLRGHRFVQSFLNQSSERFQVTPIGDRAGHRAHPDGDHEHGEGVSPHLGLERVIDRSDPILEHVTRVLKILLG